MTTLPAVPVFLLEDDLNDECRDLISSLPRETGWVSEHYYQYQGFWIAPKLLQGVVACQKHFQARDSDTILVAYPKSGSTWLKPMTFALLNRSRGLDVLLTTSSHNLVPFLEATLYGGRELPDLSAMTSPRLFATHVPIGSLPGSVKDSSCKIVYLCRNPKDVFVSFWHFANKLRPEESSKQLEEIFESFCNGVSGYGPFWDHILGYWNKSLKNPQKVLFLKYEDIYKQPAAQLKRLAEFLKCPFSPEEEAEGVIDDILKMCSFDNLSNLEVNKTGSSINGVNNQIFFRKGGVGGWKSVLTPEMIERLNRITDDKTYGSGLKF